VKVIDVAIIGAGGQVGSNLMAFLSENSRIRLHGICRNEVTAARLRMEGFDIKCGSISDPEVAGKFLSDCEMIVNCSASSGSPGKTQKEDRSVIRSLSQLPGKKRFIHLSSVGVYGTCISSVRNTFKQPKPDWPYGHFKLHLENYLASCLKEKKHEYVVLRMGHVYGKNQWLSRFILEKIYDPEFRLPFDGQLPSNAIHVRNISKAIEKLILEWNQLGTFNLQDSPESTWREVFDRHALAIEMPQVPSMNDEDSGFWAQCYRRNGATPLVVRIGSEIMLWVSKVPNSIISSCPSLKTLGTLLLGRFRSEKLDRFVMSKYLKTCAKRSLTAAKPSPNAWLFSEKAPGAQFRYDGELTSADAEEITEWHTQYAKPDAILAWNSR